MYIQGLCKAYVRGYTTIFNGFICYSSSIFLSLSSFQAFEKRRTLRTEWTGCSRTGGGAMVELEVPLIL